MNDHTFWELIGKKVTGEATKAELKQLDSLMAENPEFKQSAQKMEMLWRSGVDMDNPSSRGPQMWAKFKEQLGPDESTSETAEDQQPQKRSFYWIKYLAAASLLIFGLVWFYQSRNTGSPAIVSVIKLAPKGSKAQKFTLPDGTVVWLNAQSTLTYQSIYGEKLREVKLEGEGFFDVVKDKHHPFVVNTTAMRLKVLGTAFNVRSFATDKTVEAALIRGSIEVTLLSSPDKKIMLKPSEKLTVRNNTPVADKTPVSSVAKSDSISKVPLMVLSNIQFIKTDSSPIETQWLKHKITFNAELFEDLAPQMERYFDIKITFLDEQAKKIPFSGSFQDETLPEAMKGLQATGGFNYKVRGKEIIIYR